MYNFNIDTLAREVVDAGIAVLITAGVALLAIAVHRISFALFCRITGRSLNTIDDALRERLRSPTRWILVVIALGLASRSGYLTPAVAATWSRVIGFVAPALWGWLALSLMRFGRDIIDARADISASDNLNARRRRTRTAILARIGTFAIIFLTTSVMLLSIPGVKNVGITLMASAGLAGLAVGAAAQPALKNLIAGAQMAFTEPVRIDDVVIVEGEWGRIEEIWLTYVVVRIWDERRLVVPISHFLEKPFENWTRKGSQLLGTAFFYVDPTTNVARLRDKLKEVVHGNPNWDGRVIGMQVTDVRPDVMELRALVSARDAGKAFDLRCDVREAMMKFMQSEMPEALPRTRNDIRRVDSPGPYADQP